MTPWGAGFFYRYIMCPIGVITFFMGLFGIIEEPLTGVSIVFGFFGAIFAWFGPKMFGE